MFVVTNELIVSEENRAQFESEFSASMHATLPGVPGLRRATLLAPTEAGRGHLATMEFDDEESYRAYIRSDAFKAAHPWPGRVPLENDPTLATYTVHTDLSDPAAEPGSS